MAASSMRRCELQFYPEDGWTLDQLRAICESYQVINEYAIVIHDKDVADDGTIKKSHIHCMLKFSGPLPTEQLLNMFKGLKMSKIEKIKGRWCDAIAYLTHLNAPHKYQYSVSDVVANFDINEAVADREPSIDEYIQRCSDGEIRMFNLQTEVPAVMLVKNYALLERACKVYQSKRKDEIMDGTSAIKVYFFTGKTGTGKTTLAKQFCKDHKLSLYISSSNNDPLQDYLGQDVLVLDDARDSTFSYNDILKVLDNHTRTSIKSRYNNKFFFGKYIILTSYVGLNEWYKNKQENDGDKLQQFKRRISAIYQFYEDEIQIYEQVKSDKGDFEFIMTNRQPNYTKQFYTVDAAEDLLKTFSKKFQDKKDDDAAAMPVDYQTVIDDYMGDK